MDDQTKAKVKELVDHLAVSLKEKCEKLYRSGRVDVEEFDKTEYVLAKTLITAAMRRLADEYAPPDQDPTFISNVENLEVM